jgi:hypothetical protein
MKKCHENGIRLITLFSDEWDQRRSIVESKLISIIGEAKTKIGARKCTINIVEHNIASSFYDNYHIQGGDIRCTVHLALMHNNNSVAMMSFKCVNNVHELVRYATSMTVVGGASKLLKHYIKKYNPSNIISFADLRWSNGEMYYQLGFKLISEVPPMQSYVENYSLRHHKLKFKRHRLLDRLDGETEWDYMKRNGYDRIWDCGKLKFEMVLDKNSNNVVQYDHVNNDENEND